MLRSRVRKKDPAVRRVEHPKFPIDFFEHCQQLQYNEIEVGRGEGEEGRGKRGGKEGGGRKWEDRDTQSHDLDNVHVPIHMYVTCRCF